ncbi:hypothetical protein C2S52_012316 [Perilla frutescens var. hirtella]|nr:hypothetical protein C2S52_012316 [Perilla frutescens var. hirtella]
MNRPSSHQTTRMSSVKSVQFDFGEIRAATRNFDIANKVEEGGFGDVYKGQLSNGQEIAVKRLSNHSRQGDTEFKNELKRVNLDWNTGQKIIGGIVRALMYLHEDSRLRIIHRDVKASNVLLDIDMNPQIADFSAARSLVRDEIEGNTDIIVGTPGYIAPEYRMEGNFSIKSDVYSLEYYS